MDYHEPDPHQPSEPGDGGPTTDSGIWLSWSNGRLLIWSLLLLLGNFSVQVLVFGITDELFLPVACASVLAVILPCHLAARRTNGTLASEFHLGSAPLPILFWAFVAALGALVPTSLLAELSVRIHPVSQTWIDFYLERMPETTGEIILAAVTVILVAPVAEELLFRGIIHRLASRLWGPIPAALLSSLIFALVHAEPWYLFGLLGLGLLLAYIYEVTQSVTACAVTHATHNAISFVLLLNEGNLGTESSGTSELDLLLLGGSILLLVLACTKLRLQGWTMRD